MYYRFVRFLRSVRITPSNPHVLVFGHVSNSDVLRTFATEFYHPDRLEDLPPEASERRVSNGVFKTDSGPSASLRTNWICVSPLTLPLICATGGDRWAL